jgi:catechol 2,3-dioxygenase-like lactoylglutathione lyase family enzyme
MIDRFDHLFYYVSDFERSLVFYRDTLGWSVVSLWGEAAGERGAVLSSGALKVVLAQHPLERGLAVGQPGRANVHLDIHDVDKRFQVLPQGDHVVVPPQDTHWGTRWFVVRDPDGNLIAFEEQHPKS